MITNTEFIQVGWGAISRLFYMLILCSAPLCANAAKDGVFSGGPDFVSDRFSYTTEDWVVDPTGSTKTFYGETALSNFLDIEVIYDGQTYRSSDDPEFSKRIQPQN